MDPASSSEEEDFKDSDQEDVSQKMGDEDGENEMSDQGEVSSSDEEEKDFSDEEKEDLEDDDDEDLDDNEEQSGEDRKQFYNSNYSMGELLKLREKIGTKNFDKNFHRSNKVCDGNALKQERKRKNKNRPQELSSKQKWRSHKLIPKNNKTRDPRFDDLCGSAFNSKVFDKRYAFVNDIQDKELRKLKTQLRKKKGKGKVLKDVISRMEEKQKARNRKMEDEAVLKNWRKEENDKIAKGKKPYFLKKSQVKKLVSDHRRNKLEEDGLLDKVSRKKEKKLAGKQRKNLPERRHKT